MPIFGNTEIGSIGNGATASRIYAARFYLPEDSWISKLTVYLGSASYGGNIRALIYSDSDSIPNALLACKELYVNNANPPTWKDFEFASFISLKENYYWLSVQFEKAGMTLYTEGSGGISGTNLISVWGTEPTDPFGSFSDQTILHSIYATYTAKQRKIPTISVKRSYPIEIRNYPTFL